MKSFKGYISEAQAHFNTKDMIFTNAETPALILSTTALERAFGKLERITAWHVTDIEGLQGLKKIQGKKSSISVLTSIRASNPTALDGVETGGGIVVQLEGTELMASNQDAWSERLESGRRAIPITKENFPSMFRHMVFMVKKMYEKYSKKPQSKDPRKAAMDFNGLAQTLSQKEKGQFIKEYIDNCEDIITKNKKGQQELRNYGRFEKGHKYAPYNESVVNQISIKNVYAVIENWDTWASSEWGSGDTEEKFDDEEKLLQKVWKGLQIKSQNELITMINKK